MLRLFFFFFIIFLLTACNPQKRLNRLIKNHPELAKTDTIYSSKIVSAPGYTLDTSFKASNNVSGLTELIDTYKDFLDSIRRVKLTSEIKTYILDRNCLQDTFKVALNNGGFCKFWQHKGVFYYQLHQPPKKYKVTVPVQYQKFNVTTKYNWVMFWAGISAILLLEMTVVIILKWLKP
ncbi:MAG: hypothetical protein K0R26_1900 [Bacteroidota bacterium]|jgi:hypothetical protein|nr:hypothetical protein [Bacteroidota bacterium]